MLIKEGLEKQGAFLFKWRSYAPLALVPAIIIAIVRGEPIERAFGETANTLWEIFAILVSFAGLAMRAAIVGYVPKNTSGRNTGGQLAESLNTTGMYSVCRNPLYLANFLILLGFLIFIQVWWLIVLGTVLFWIYYERIIFSEEAYLRAKFGAVYLEWAERTPGFFPRARNWRAPSMPFSLRIVLRRELSTLLQIVLVTTLLHVGIDLAGEHTYEFERGWQIYLAAGTAAFLILLVLKKNGVLNVKGR